MCVGVAGLFCLDIVPKINEGQTLAPGLMVEVDECTISPGGPVSNVGVALSKMGMENIYAFATVGKDVFSNVLLSKVSPYLIVDKIKFADCATAYTIAITVPGVDRTYLHCRNASNHFSVKNIDLEGVPSLKWFHFGYPPLIRQTVKNDGKELKNIFSLIKKRNSQTIISLDMSTPNDNSINWNNFFSNVLPFVDVFCPSIEEILLMCHNDVHKKLKNKYKNNFISHMPLSLLRRVSDKLSNYGCKSVILKMGSCGLYAKIYSEVLNWKKQEIRCPAYKCKVVNAIGAGDACVAGLIFSALRGDTADKSMRFATKIASYSVRSINAFELIPKM